MTHLKQDEQISPPLYVRLVFLCHDCMAQVEKMKTNLFVQLPFMYAHMLAVLVHSTNILMAISCGMSLGSAMSEMRERSAAIKMAQLRGGSYVRLLGEFYAALQVLGMQFVILLIQPMLYQSFLVIADALCHPYGDQICHL